MNSSTDWVIVGRFGRPHGIKGFITVCSFTDPNDNILQYPHWHIRIEDTWQPITLLTTEITHKALLVKVEGYEQREHLTRLTNHDIAVTRDTLPILPVGEYYWHQLIGMVVVNQRGDMLGSVKEILPTGSHDVLVVEGVKRCLIPYLPGIHVLAINDETREITVEWDSDF